MRRRVKAKTCAVPGCGEAIPRRNLMCLLHWNRVTIGTQERVRYSLKSWRTGEPVQSYIDAVTAAVAEARR